MTVLRMGRNLPYFCQFCTLRLQMGLLLSMSLTDLPVHKVLPSCLRKYISAHYVEASCWCSSHIAELLEKRMILTERLAIQVSTCAVCASSRSMFGVSFFVFRSSSSQNDCLLPFSKSLGFWPWSLYQRYTSSSYVLWTWLAKWISHSELSLPYISHFTERCKGGIFKRVSDVAVGIVVITPIITI